MTIADYVADYRAATPTSAAEHIVRSRLDLESHLDQVRLRLATQMSTRLNLLRERVDGLRHRLISPTMQLALWRQRLQESSTRLQRAVVLSQQRRCDGLTALAGRLDVLSPLRTLQRGYAIVQRDKDGSSVINASALASNERLKLRFASGWARVRVEEVKP